MARKFNIKYYIVGLLSRFSKTKLTTSVGRHGEGYHNQAESYYGTPAWDVRIPSSVPTSPLTSTVLLVRKRRQRNHNLGRRSPDLRRHRPSPQSQHLLVPHDHGTKDNPPPNLLHLPSDSMLTNCQPDILWSPITRRIPLHPHHQRASQRRNRCAYL